MSINLIFQDIEAFKFGAKFLIDGKEYLLARTSETEACLVSYLTGNRWQNPKVIDDRKLGVCMVSRKDMLNLLGDLDQVETISLIKEKTHEYSTSI